MKEHRNIIILLLIVSAVIIFAVYKKEDNSIVIDLGSYAEYQYVGANGTASIEDSYNYEKLERDLLRQVEPLNKEREKLNTFIHSIQFSFGPAVDLSNGDTVNVVSIYSGSEWLKKYGVKLDNISFSFEVEGLPEPIELDLFKDLQIDIKGIYPNGAVELKNNAINPFIQNIDYMIFYETAYKPLKNGDIVIIAADYDIKEAKKMGYLIKEDSKNILVNSIDEYVTDKNEIDEKTSSDMEQAGKDYLQQFFQPGVDSTYRQHFFYPAYGKSVNFITIHSLDIKEVKLVSNIFMVRKEEFQEQIPDNYKKQLPNTWVNANIFVYKISFVTDVTPEGKTNVVYVPVIFSSLIKHSSNQIEYKINENASVQDRNDSLNGVYEDALNPYQTVYTWEVNEF